MKKSVFKATGIVFVLSLVAKVIGFIKSMIEASYYGTSLEMDAYNVSSGFVSNILYMLTTAIAVAFVPIYIQHKNDDNERKIFATRTITTLGSLSLILICLLVISSPLIIYIIAPSFDVETQALAIKYFRVLSLGIVFSLMANLFTSVLNAEKRFGYSTLSSVINSIVLIFFIIVFSERLGVWALVLAMPVTFVIQWIALYIVGRQYASVSLKYGLKDESIKVLIIQAAPILLSQATVEINQVVDRALLSGIEVGALTAVSYSMVLYQFVTTLISTPISTVMFTELSEAGAEKNKERIKSILVDSFRVLVVICIPVIIISYYCSKDIVSFVYGHGKFTGDAIRQCAEGLRMYVLCLLPVSIKAVLSRAYYGLNDTKHPMILGMLEVALNIILSILLVKQFGILGVVGATAISSFVFIVVMIIDFNRRYTIIFDLSTLISYWKMSFGLLLLVALFILVGPRFQLPALENFILKAVLGFVVYFGCLYIIKESTLLQISEILKKTINRRV